MSPPTTLDDKDYRAIALAARRYTVWSTERGCFILDTQQDDYPVRGPNGTTASQTQEETDLMNGRADAAEYERRRK